MQGRFQYFFKHFTTNPIGARKKRLGNNPPPALRYQTFTGFLKLILPPTHLPSFSAIFMLAIFEILRLVSKYYVIIFELEVFPLKIHNCDYISFQSFAFLQKFENLHTPAVHLM